MNLGGQRYAETLPRIGPGLGARNGFWTKVRNRIIFEGKSHNIDPSESERLLSLASGARWLDMVPPEWREIYGALHDESKFFIIPESERNKIDKDIGRTFSLFTRNARLLRLQFKDSIEEYSKALQNVLMAASHERGYCQGINFIAAVFLLYQANEKESFTLLCYLLKQRYLEILYNPKCSSLLEYMNYFEKRLRKHNKRVYKYFKAIDYSPVCYSIEWFTTCFIVTCPGELSSCVLDLILIGYEDIMIRVGLAMLDHLEEQLLKLDLEAMQLEFKPLASKADPYEVMFRALTIPVPPNARANLLQKMAVNIEVMNPRAELVNTLRAAKKDEEEDAVGQQTRKEPLTATTRGPVSQSRKRGKKNDKKGSNGSQRTSGGRRASGGGEVSPLSPVQEDCGESCSENQFADDEAVHHGVPRRGASAAGSIPSPPASSSSSFRTTTPPGGGSGRRDEESGRRQRRAANGKVRQGITDAVNTIKLGIQARRRPNPSSVVASPPKAPQKRPHKQSKPETRFSKSFLKRIPTRRTATTSTQLEELEQWADSFTSTKKYEKKPISPARTKGISKTPTNASVSSPQKLLPASKIVQPTVDPLGALLSVPPPPKPSANQPRMILDPESPFNVERQEKKQAKMVNLMFGQAAVPKKPTQQPVAEPVLSAASSSAGKRPQQPVAPAAASPVPTGGMWFDKVVQDTLWFTTFGLVHAPASKPAPPLASQKAPPTPPWVAKKELQQKHLQRTEDDDLDVLLWIPGTQEGYDGDLSAGQETDGIPGFRDRSRAPANKDRILSIDIHGRRSLVDDLEKPIDLLANIDAMWFSPHNKANPALRVLNKQYHNEGNLTIRRLRNKKRSFREKL